MSRKTVMNPGGQAPLGDKRIPLSDRSEARDTRERVIGQISLCNDPAGSDFHITGKREEVAIVNVNGNEYGVIADGIKSKVRNTLKAEHEGQNRLDEFLKRNQKIDEFLKLNSISIKAKPFKNSFYYEVTHTPTGAKEQVMGNPVTLNDKDIPLGMSMYISNIELEDGSVSTLFNVIDGVGSRLSDIIRPMGFTPIGAKSDGSDSLFREFEEGGVDALLNDNGTDIDLKTIGMELLSILTGLKKTGVFVDGMLVQQGKMGLCLIHTVEVMGEYVLAFGDDVMEILPLGAMNFLGSMKMEGFQVLARPDLISDHR